MDQLISEIAEDAINAALELLDEKELSLSKEDIRKSFPEDFEPEIAQAVQHTEQILCAKLTGLAVDYVNKMKLTKKEK